MSPDQVFLMVIIVVSITMTASVLTTWIKRRGVSPKALSGVQDRLGRIEQAVDAMALEIERISEGQRFTTKLLAERTE